MANAQKNHPNYVIMQIITKYFALHTYEQNRVVSKCSMQINLGLEISERQFILGILY